VSIKKKILAAGASVALLAGLALGTAAPANAAQGSIRNTGPGNAFITNGSSQYTLYPNGQAYYASTYRVPVGFCAKSPTLGLWCPTSSNVWRGIPAGQHTIQVLYIHNV
jgi:hypothetical protein